MRDVMSEALPADEGWFGVTPALRISGPMTFGRDLQALHVAAARAAAGGYRRIVLDLSRIDAFDSSGIAAILELTASNELGFRQLVLVDVPDRLLKALAMLHAPASLVTTTRDSELMQRLGPWRTWI